MKKQIMSALAAMAFQTMASAYEPGSVESGDTIFHDCDEARARAGRDAALARRP
ncbi:MAG: hypothetical protein ABIS45_12685 [Burkholderiales bacterium]